MNIFFKVLTTSKRFQDTAGIARGAFRVLQGFQCTNSEGRSFPDKIEAKFSPNQNNKGQSEKTEAQPKEKDPSPEKITEKSKEEKKNELPLSNEENVKTKVVKDEKKGAILKNEEQVKEAEKAAAAVKEPEKRSAAKEPEKRPDVVMESDNAFGSNESKEKF